MWAKDGERFLAQVLRQIDAVIPRENVCHKILIDDHSVDNTRKIARDFNWTIHTNSRGGISNGANEALNLVDTAFFASFEQDLLLSSVWFNKIPHLLDNPKVAIASGLRLIDKPLGLRKLQEYNVRSDVYGMTLDNTIYKTEIMRSIGGFPVLERGAGVDTVLSYEISRSGYRWKVDLSVRSDHLRKGLRHELKQQYWYSSSHKEIDARINVRSRLSNGVRRFVLSPASGLLASIRLKEPSIAYIYPLMRYYYLKGLLDGRKWHPKHKSC